MEKRFVAALAACVCAACVSGCASVETDENPDVALSRIDSEYRYITASEIKTTAPLTVGMLTLDFSDKNVKMRFEVGEFRPGAGPVVNLRMLTKEKDVMSLAELRKQIDKRVMAAPIGMFVVADGVVQGSGRGSDRMNPAHGIFFREFHSMMSNAGIDYVFIYPEKLNIVR